MGLKTPERPVSAANGEFPLDGSVARVALSLLAPSVSAAGAGGQQPSADSWAMVQRVVGPRLLPLLGHVADARGVVLPPAVRLAVAAATRDSQMAWMRRRPALDAMLRALRVAGLEASVLKGMALARTTYPAPALRFMTDIDLWLHAPDARAALAPLAPLGWRMPAWRDLGWSDPSAVIGLAHGEPQLLVEIHAEPNSLQRVVPSLTDTMGARTTTVDGWRVLAPSDQLLHLATHAHSHGYAAGIQGLVDIAWFLSRHRDAIDWDQAAIEWKQAGGARCVAVALSATEQLFGVSAPEAAWTALDASGVREIAREAAESAWWTHLTGENPQAIFAAGPPMAVTRALLRQLRVFLREKQGFDAGAPRRLVRRLVRLAGRTVPRHLHAIARGEYRGVSGAMRRDRSARHAALVRALSAPATDRE